MSKGEGGRFRPAGLDEAVSSTVLVLMMLIPLVEVACRPLFGSGIDNAPVLVQHLGLVLAMSGALAAARLDQLAALGTGFASSRDGRVRAAARALASGTAALVCGALMLASARFVAAEQAAGRALAYGIPVWWVQGAMPLGFALLGLRLGARCATATRTRIALALALPAAGALLAGRFDGTAVVAWPLLAWLAVALVCGAPIFAVLGGLALTLFLREAQPLASVPLSHYQITVNPSLPALPLFTLAGLVFAKTGAARRLGSVFAAMFGASQRGTVVAAAILCSIFTAFTGGSGVTILALGGLLLALLRDAGYPEARGVGLVTSASALGVLLAPSVPLIMYSVVARVPIDTMFLAGVVPAIVMVGFLLAIGGFLRTGPSGVVPVVAARRDGAGGAHAKFEPAHGAADRWRLPRAIWAAKWEIVAPLLAIGSLVSGLATPIESAALTAAYAVATQALAHRELDSRSFGECLAECARVIGAVMLILGMALGLTSFLVDAGVPDAAIDWVRGVVPSRFAFLLALNVFLLAAGALMEIFAALVVLVPLLLPVASSYGIDPVHFGVIFLANMEMGFLCPPAGMNLYFASAMFGRPVRQIAVSVLPALLAIFLGTLVISLLPVLATGLPGWVGGR